ncbi:hypothetical protein QTI66_17460 [Variovorax sp. J22R133]|uniref:DUF6988 family protein n=1 Tax=Variovorax brevis TaxID=3053503 RepID=UPI0025767271|nr:hypothetical protein [Variovorax sp. J22R133]MDM0113946.1 hypothetical protein [Variovorax sp. J22R133]
MRKHDGDTRLAELLEASEALDEDMGKLLGKCQPRSKRGIIATALCGAAFEHALSQRVLISAGLTGTALALRRLHVEAVVRAVWTAQCANDEWLEKLTAPVDGPDHEEPAPKVGIATMLSHIKREVPNLAAEFARLLTTIKAMHFICAHRFAGSRARSNAVVPQREIDCRRLESKPDGVVRGECRSHRSPRPWPRPPHAPAPGKAWRVHAADFSRAELRTGSTRPPKGRIWSTD